MKSLTNLNVNFLDATLHTPLGKIDDVLILVNGNYVPIDFIVMDLDFKLPCTIFFWEDCFLELLVPLLI